MIYCALVLLVKYLNPQVNSV